MLPLVTKKRRDGNSSFKTLAAYLTEAVDKETGELIQRGEIMLSPALLSAETAAIEMWAAAKENSRCGDPALHMVISWQTGEHPKRDQWEKAVTHAMESIGLGEHQFMAVAHTDTDNFHVHIMASRVHPETYRAHAPEWLFKTLAKACREIEAEQGWREDNGLYKWDEDKGRAVPLSRAEIDALRESGELRGLETGEAGKGRAAKMERFGNAESLQTFCKGDPANVLTAVMKRDRATWQDVHAALARHGLTILQGDKGGYSVVSAAGEKVKASDVFRRQFAGKTTREATEAKLGEWQPYQERQPAAPAKSYSPHREPRRDPTQRAERRDERAALRADLKARYQAYKQAYNVAKAKRRPAEQAETKARYAELARQTRERRAAIRAKHRSPTERNALLSVAAAEAVQSKDALRAELAEHRQADRPQDFRTWVEGMAVEGDAAAISQLRGWHYTEQRRRRSNQQPQYRNYVMSASGEDLDPIDPRTVSAVASMTWRVDKRTGSVAYQVDGEQAFTDRGRELALDSDDRRAREAALRVAVQKFGPSISIEGSEEYKAELVDIAVRAGIRVDFNDTELNRRYDEGVEEVAAGRRYLAQTEKATADRKPAPAQERPTPVPRTRSRSTDDQER
jgi:hypothetical protein